VGFPIGWQIDVFIMIIVSFSGQMVIEEMMSLWVSPLSMIFAGQQKLPVKTKRPS